jgi:hypothetical protein
VIEMLDQAAPPLTFDEYLEAVTAERDALVASIREKTLSLHEDFSTYATGTGARFEAGRAEVIADAFGRLTALDKITWVLKGVMEHHEFEEDRVNLARKMMISYLATPEGQGLPPGFFGAVNEFRYSLRIIEEHARTTPAPSR